LIKHITRTVFEKDTFDYVKENYTIFFYRIWEQKHKS